MTLVWLAQTSYKNRTADVFLTQEQAEEAAKRYKELLRKQLEIPVSDKREHWICNHGPFERTWSIGSSWVRVACVEVQGLVEIQVPELPETETST
jgi:hypothetical protein